MNDWRSIVWLCPKKPSRDPTALGTKNDDGDASGGRTQPSCIRKTSIVRVAGSYCSRSLRIGTAAHAHTADSNKANRIEKVVVDENVPAVQRVAALGRRAATPVQAPRTKTPYKWRVHRSPGPLGAVIDTAGCKGPSSMGRMNFKKETGPGAAFIAIALASLIWHGDVPWLSKRLLLLRS